MSVFTQVCLFTNSKPNNKCMKCKYINISLQWILMKIESISNLKVYKFALLVMHSKTYHKLNLGDQNDFSSENLYCSSKGHFAYYKEVLGELITVD